MQPDVGRRQFLGATAASGAFTIVPRHLLGGQSFVAPSDKITVGYVGCGTQGLLFVGDKGKLLDGRIIPESRMKAYAGPQPPAPQARGGAGRGQAAGETQPSAGPLAEWIRACRGGPQAARNFLNAIPLTEAANLHAVALRSSRKLQYDPARMTVTNVADAGKHLTREYRKGWEL
jgi:hypothetical protein